MKKAAMYIIILFLVTIVTVSGTYAFFGSTIGGKNALNNIETHNLNVIYGGDNTEIGGYIELVKSKEEGFRRTIYIALGDDSVPVSANLYIYLEQITAGFSSVALKWELYELNGKEEKYVDDGTFDGYQSGDKVYMLKNLKLTLTPKEYVVYLWLNGYEAGNEVVGAVLRGYIGAETEIVSGILE